MQCMPSKNCNIVKYHIMAPLFSIDEVCHVCSKVYLNTFGKHACYYKELSGFKCRHHFVKKVLFDICRRERVFVKKKTYVNLLTDPLEGRSTLKSANVWCTSG